jgi:hypothetical protein
MDIPVPYGASKKPHALHNEILLLTEAFDARDRKISKRFESRPFTADCDMFLLGPQHPFFNVFSVLWPAEDFTSPVAYIQSMEQARSLCDILSTYRKRYPTNEASKLTMNFRMLGFELYLLCRNERPRRGVKVC